jgi:hypothetical protein
VEAAGLARDDPRLLDHRCGTAALVARRVVGRNNLCQRAAGRYGIAH